MGGYGEAVPETASDAVGMDGVVSSVAVPAPVAAVPAPVGTAAAVPGTAAPAAGRSAAGWRIAALLRIEDVLLTVAIVVAAPLLVGNASAGPFDSGQPVQGGLRLGAVLLALACAAARRAPVDGRPAATLTSTGALGPFSGSVFLVAASGANALGLGPEAIYPSLGIAAAVMIAARLLLPPLSANARRALMTPFVLVATGLFWTFMNIVFGRPVVSGGLSGLTPDVVRSLVGSPVFLFMAAFAAIYYAMLVYAPRQAAEPEGSALAWLVRFGVFFVGVVVGVGWLGALGV